ncbi:C40 family peptidase [Eubacterium oxidoreducens]|uniref:Cell wall-associated hydrolase, NlpC family n=1 Tax=Eubacterium oxidoreducens TaxID=1732 RepID=A0A1G6AP39_EUBOX|nr:C40 family peptidase [Eubacterium oxidoreducens]SDB09943.1 Cell wall-associated hydrolase, NlpC family [Eubacterium oxidoreducens]
MKSIYVRFTILGLSAVMILGTGITTFAAQTSLSAGAGTIVSSALFDSENETSLSAGASSVFSDAIESSESQAVKTASVSKNESDTSEKESDDTIYGYTNLGIADCEDYINIRKKASKESDIAGRLEKDAACEIIKTSGSWTKIKSGDVTGWVKSKYLLTGDAAKERAEEVAKTVATVNTKTLNIRTKKSTDSSIVAQVGEDTELKVLKEGSKWIKVKYDGEKGYVSAEYVTVSVELEDALTATEVEYGEGVSDVRSALVQYALQFVGNPYVWGGTSLTNGCDCSGFTMRILGSYGVGLPHSSSAQSNYGTRISASKAQPGDLFFYGSGSSISHVAIYIGNGQIVHASNERDGIKVSSAYYRTPICVCSYF